MWTLRYLHKFKWENLTEKMLYDQKVREQKLKTELSKAKREFNFYQEKVDLARKLTAMEAKKAKKNVELEKDEEEEKQDFADHEEDGEGPEEDEGNGEEEGEDAVFKRKRKKNLDKMFRYHKRQRRAFRQNEPIRIAE